MNFQNQVVPGISEFPLQPTLLHWTDILSEYRLSVATIVLNLMFPSFLETKVKHTHSQVVPLGWGYSPDPFRSGCQGASCKPLIAPSELGWRVYSLKGELLGYCGIQLQTSMIEIIITKYNDLFAHHALLSTIPHSSSFVSPIKIHIWLKAEKNNTVFPSQPALIWVGDDYRLGDDYRPSSCTLLI